MGHRGSRLPTDIFHNTCTERRHRACECMFCCYFCFGFEFEMHPTHTVSSGARPPPRGPKEMLSTRSRKEGRASLFGRFAPQASKNTPTCYVPELFTSHLLTGFVGCVLFVCWPAFSNTCPLSHPHLVEKILLAFSRWQSGYQKSEKSVSISRKAMNPLCRPEQAAKEPDCPGSGMR